MNPGTRADSDSTPREAPPTPRRAGSAVGRAPSSSSRRGFTLTELLIVIGIIVLIVALAVPSFRAMTGGRSPEAAQNAISAVLARARTEALGLQEIRGVMFYRDQETRRVGMALVQNTNVGLPRVLDLVPDREPVLLPIGVGIQFVDDVPPDPLQVDQYIGFNTRTVRASDTGATIVPFGGVVLFDAKGRLMSDEYTFRLRYPATGANPVARAAEMGKFLMNEPELSTTGPEAIVMAADPISKLGFVLFVEEDFSAVFREGRGDGVTEDHDYQHDARITAFGTVGASPPSSPTNEAEEEHWLSRNGVPILVNRYNGTLVRGE